MRTLDECYDDIVSPANLWRAWTLYRRGKRSRRDVQEFERRLESNLSALRTDLSDGPYIPGGYRSFTVHDPKRRVISAPRIHDQVVHQAVWNVLFPFFDRLYSSAVHSCRPGRGTHSAVRSIARIAHDSRGRVFILHLDVVKFFDSVRHDVLLHLLGRWVTCPRTLRLLVAVIGSYDSGLKKIGDPADTRRGIPLGNLTSQLFCNVVLMPFDRTSVGSPWARRYVRYADDIFILGSDEIELIAVGRACAETLSELGLDCRMRIPRFHGFESLGVRFFEDGVVSRRSTRVRALRGLQKTVGYFHDGRIGARDLEARSRSHFGLETVRDLRWTNAVRETILRPSDVCVMAP